jgi:galactarate dehydratase (EC 4.2.1.42)
MQNRRISMEATIAKDVNHYIKVHEQDNVAIIVKDGGLPGRSAAAGGGWCCGRMCPRGHKVALVDIPQGGEILRYGEVIGYAKKAISSGCWIEESLVLLPQAPELSTLPLANKVPAKQEPLVGYTFAGYRNVDGTVGTKNLLGIVTSVQCAAGVVNQAVARIRQELLPLYPEVEDVVAVNHNYGCGVAIGAPEAVIPIRTLQNLATHPNFGGEALIVGLGCEKAAS